MSKFTIPVILGTAREGRESMKVAEFLVAELSKHEKITTELVDVADHLYGHTHPAWIEYEETNKWKEITGNADGFVFVVPEYNAGFPGELKLLIDAAYKEYLNKPALLCGVSSGMFGGKDALASLRPILQKVGMKPLGYSSPMFFSKVKETFNEDGTVKDEKLIEMIQERAELLVKHAEVYKTLRT